MSVQHHVRNVYLFLQQVKRDINMSPDTDNITYIRVQTSMRIVWQKGKNSKIVKTRVIIS